VKPLTVTALFGTGALDDPFDGEVDADGGAEAVGFALAMIDCASSGEIVCVVMLSTLEVVAVEFDEEELEPELTLVRASMPNICG
jgi:hypothetical protein